MVMETQVQEQKTIFEVEKLVCWQVEALLAVCNKADFNEYFLPLVNRFCECEELPEYMELFKDLSKQIRECGFQDVVMGFVRGKIVDYNIDLSRERI